MLKDSGLGCPTANYRVNIGNSYVILDMAYPDCRVAFEYQGAYHADPAQMRIDAAKRNALQLLGWIVILVTADDLRTADTRHRFIEMAHVVVSSLTAFSRVSMFVSSAGFTKPFTPVVFSSIAMRPEALRILHALPLLLL